MDKESFVFEECNVNIVRKDGKVVVGIEYGKPMSLVYLMGFIDILGKPLNFAYEKGDEYILFLFNDKVNKPDFATLWESEFNRCKPTVPSANK